MNLRIGGTYQHKKRGTKYEVEGRMKLQIIPETLLRNVPNLGQTNAALVCEALEKMAFVSYSSKDDEEALYGRPETEFLDGRFKDVTPKSGWVLTKLESFKKLYHSGGKKWTEDKRDAKLYSEEVFALRDWAELFTSAEREKIYLMRIEQEQK